MAPLPGPCIFHEFVSAGLRLFYPLAFWTALEVASDEDHRRDEEERCTDHQNIQGMCESHWLTSLRLRFDIKTEKCVLERRFVAATQQQGTSRTLFTDPSH
jgi:hypothetical protein